MLRPFLLLLVSLPALAADAPAFVRELRARLAAAPCAARVASRLEDFEAIPDGAFHDLARLPLAEAERAIRTSVAEGTRTGGKTFELTRFGNDMLLRRFKKELRRVLEEAAREEAKTPLYLAIVGLGREAAELLLVAELVDEMLEELRGPGTKEALAARLDLRLGAYDVAAEPLRTAEIWQASLEKRYGWLRGKVDVRYFDMTVPEFALTWDDGRRLGLVLARNSLRNLVVEHGWPLLLISALALVPGGLFGTDSEAARRIVGPYAFLNELPDEVRRILPDFDRVFENLGPFGHRNEPDDLDDNVLLRRR